MTTKHQSSFSVFLDFAHELADHSGRAVLPHFRKATRVHNKSTNGAFDPVTAADRAAERAIARAIKARYADHGVIGEEFGASGADARYRWVVDPIDGTRAFIMGSPLWGTLIGLMDGETPILGVMDQPFTRERFWSGARSSFLRAADGRTRRIATSACQKLGDAILSTTDPHLFASGTEADGLSKLEAKARMTRYGGDCYAYCLLAAGFVDVIVEAGLKAHDVVALIPIIEKAGGVITTWEGEPASRGGRIAAAGNARLHDQVLSVLARS